MRSKRSVAPFAQWIVDPEHASSTTVPVGAVLATEPVFLQLAHEAQISWLVRGSKSLSQTTTA
jgi:hypothetical protein